MHPDVIRKMNELIGFLKVVEREISAYGSIYEKKNIIRSRTPDIMKQYEELNKLMAEKGIDELTNSYYKQITDEISKVLQVRDPMDISFPNRFNK